MKNVLKILAVGGIVYLAYRYLYPYLLEKKETELQFDENDDRTTFWGEDEVSYVRGYAMPNNIDDFSINNPILITKPDEEIFGEPPRTAIEVKLDREKNKIEYYPVQRPKEIFVADYNELKDRVVMLNKDLKK
jgi:hypothetical protein